ncbi:MAG TPA: bacillithiol biosynthesis cysteine-adding enzyme BshC [Candidatus Hydrogenedentes bacterium]|nr:bacillithiol biosynthesis cysteine-adding enzyme BshC [Candidatus Hydrogenedentota bacterium]HNT88141.1 bacillithiol biosynthesis cysteine-adding enzyme BshC [Candidatus Hydrogenedentota bacterium]
MRSLADAYRDEAPALTPLYAGSPRSIFAPETNRVAPADWNPELVAALRAYQREIGLEPRFTGREAVIVTGQQPGLFTGPLYTVYKALTAVKLAARLEQTHGVPVVPVFWLGSDDHDFEEARRVGVLTRRHEPLMLTYSPRQSVDGLPLYRVPVEDSLHELVDALREAAPGSERADDVAAFLHGSLDGADSFSAWTARLLARLFRDTPLVVFEPRLPAARRIAAGVFAREIERPLASTVLVREAARRIEALGFSPQLLKGPTECNFFVEIAGRRRKVVFEEGVFKSPEEGASWSQAELASLLEHAPERLSANVALRCIVQQALFSATAYVAGPGEIAYWAQLKEVFAFFEQPMPIVYPRARVMLTTTKLRKLLEKFQWRAADLFESPDVLLNRALAAAVRHPGLDILTRDGETVLGAVEALAYALRAMVASGPPLDAVNALGDKTRAELERIERLLRRADEAQVDAVGKQVARLCNALAPGRKPQDRVYTVFSFLFEHGWDLMPRLLEAIDIGAFATTEVEL